jgi:hypothetical protein
VVRVGLRLGEKFRHVGRSDAAGLPSYAHPTTLVVLVGDDNDVVHVVGAAADLLEYADRFSEQIVTAGDGENIAGADL